MHGDGAGAEATTAGAGVTAANVSEAARFFAADSFVFDLRLLG